VGAETEIIDATTCPAWSWPASRKTPRAYQHDAGDAVINARDGLIVLPTGSGKTVTALSAAERISSHTLIICPTTTLADQWVAAIRDDYGDVPVGRVYGGVADIEPITVALPHSLTAALLGQLSGFFGTIIVDECHHGAAAMWMSSIEKFRARYRIGVSADPRRRDDMHFRVTDTLGPVVYRRTRRRVERSGATVPVILRVVRTGGPLNSLPKDMSAAERMLIGDARRAQKIDAVVSDAAGPVLVFCRLRESVDVLSRRWECPGLKGGTSSRQRREFQAVLAGVECGDTGLIVATYAAMGEGVDLKVLRSGVLAGPIGGDTRGLGFNQIRGRLARTAPGKDEAYLYHIWDDLAWPNRARLLAKLNDGLVQVQDKDGSWRMATDRDLRPAVPW
jgi:superfamily II DNA or RNA helicase